MYSRWYWCFWLWHFIKTKTNSTHKVELALYQILKNKSYDKSKETCCWSACCAAYPPQHVLNFKGWKYKWCESVNPSILTRIFKTAWEFAQPAYMHFMDLEKSNDRIPRDVVWGVLWEYAVLAHYYWLIQAIRPAKCGKSLVCVTHGKSDWFLSWTLPRLPFVKEAGLSWKTWVSQSDRKVDWETNRWIQVVLVVMQIE